MVQSQKCIYENDKNSKICTIRIDGICNLPDKCNCKMYVKRSNLRGKY